MNPKWIQENGRFYDVNRAKLGCAVDLNKHRNVKYICRDIKKLVNSDSSIPSHRIKLYHATDLIFGATKLISQLADGTLNEIFGPVERYPEEDTEEIGLEQLQEKSSLNVDNSPLLNENPAEFIITECEYQQSVNEPAKVPPTTLPPLKALSVPDIRVSVTPDVNAEDGIHTYTKNLQSFDAPSTSTQAHLNIPDLVLIDTAGNHSKLSTSRSLLPYNQSIFETYEEFTKSEYMDLESASEVEKVKKNKKLIFIDEGSKRIKIKEAGVICWTALNNRRKSKTVKLISKLHPNRLFKESEHSSRILSKIICRNMIMRRDPRSKEMDNLDKMLFLESNVRMVAGISPVFENKRCTRMEMSDGDNNNISIDLPAFVRSPAAENVNDSSNSKRQTISTGYFAKPPLGSDSAVWEKCSTPLEKVSHDLSKVNANAIPPRVIVRDSMSPNIDEKDEHDIDIESNDLDKIKTNLFPSISSKDAYDKNTNSGNRDEAVSNLDPSDVQLTTNEQEQNSLTNVLEETFSRVKRKDSDNLLHKGDGEQSTSEEKKVTISLQGRLAEHRNSRNRKNEKRKLCMSYGEISEDSKVGCSSKKGEARQFSNASKEATHLPSHAVDTSSDTLMDKDGEQCTSEGLPKSPKRQRRSAEYHTTKNRQNKRRKRRKPSRENSEDSVLEGSSQMRRDRHISEGPTGNETVLSFILPEIDENLSGVKVIVADLRSHESLYKKLRDYEHSDGSSSE